MNNAVKDTIETIADGELETEQKQEFVGKETIWPIEA